MHMTIMRVATIGLVGAALYYFITQREKSRHPTGVPGPSNFQKTCNCNYAPLVGCIHGVRGGTPSSTRCQYVPFLSENCAIPLAADYLDCSPQHTAAISQCNQGVNMNDSDNNTWRIARREVASSFPIGIRVGRISIGARIVLSDQPVCNPYIQTCVPNTEVI